MNNKPPYYHSPYYGYQHSGYPQTDYPQTGPSQPESQPDQNAGYKQQNSKTHFAMGLAAGAAVAYLLSNKKFQQGVSSTSEKVWSTVRGEVEELKERLEDTQAELDYYRELSKGDK